MSYTGMTYTCLFCHCAFSTLPFYGCCGECYASSVDIRAQVDKSTRVAIDEDYSAAEYQGFAWQPSHDGEHWATWVGVGVKMLHGNAEEQFEASLFLMSEWGAVVNGVLVIKPRKQRLPAAIIRNPGRTGCRV
ncbi:MAG: hypothetical protein ACXVCX_21455 [Ktedonobacterales bacterium]